MAQEAEVSAARDSCMASIASFEGIMPAAHCILATWCERRMPWRRYEMGRQAANTKLSTNVAVRRVRVRGGNFKFRALRLDSGNFSWGSEAVTRKTRILDVVYNASNNELVSRNGRAKARLYLGSVTESYQGTGASMLHSLTVRDELPPQGFARSPQWQRSFGRTLTGGPYAAHEVCAATCSVTEADSAGPSAARQFSRL